MNIGSILGMFLLLIIVGAIIGGITNSIAIKMLFRPHKPLYIGKWRLPFTPGVIPKRREEIAKQLGKLVMKHLLTADSLEKKLLDHQFLEQLTNMIQTELNKWLSKSEPLLNDLPDDRQRQKVVAGVDTTLSQWVLNVFDNVWEENQETQLKSILPDQLKFTVESHLPEFSRYLSERLTDYLESDEGREKVKGQLDLFFEGKGFLGSMIGMFLGNQSLMDKLYPDLIRFLNQPSFIMTIHRLLEKEWIRLQDQTLKELDETMNARSTIVKLIDERLTSILSVERLFEKSPTELLKHVKQPLLENVPTVVRYGIKTIAGRTADILQALDLEKLITDQVSAFSIQELEEVVLLISKREFKMITYLGGLLGGIIGVIQGIIMLFIR